MKTASRGDEVMIKTTLVGDDKIAMEYEYDHDVVIRHTRKTEKGIITRIKKLPIAMVFQSNPIWLLALEPNYVEKIFMVDFESFSQLAKHLTDKELDFTLYNSLVSYLGRSSFSFKSPPEDVLHLISGNVNFLNEKASVLRIKRFLYCSDVHHKYRRVLPHSKFLLRRMRHYHVGGATDFEVLWCTHDGTDNTTPSKLQRKIGDYIDYGNPPDSKLVQKSVIPHTALLPIKRIFDTISFPTHYIKSGLGNKKLTIKEFIPLFGLPTRTNRINLTFNSFPTVPVQILDTLLMPFSQKDTSTSKVVHSLRETKPQPKEHPDFLPTLGCILPPD